MATLIYIVAIFGIALLALVVCIVSDRIKQRRALKRIRYKLASEADVSDEEFAAAFNDTESGDALEMRGFMAAMLAVDSKKIRGGWRFREDRDMKIFDGFILHAFAMRYAPQRLRNGRTFMFPTRSVETVRELFLDAMRFQKDDE